ncbi:MAG: arginine--tRNA ligase [Burkholderiaceae bacterium]
MIQAKQELLAALAVAIREVSPEAALSAGFESPKLAAHGDLACTAALQLSKSMGKPPRDVAQALLTALRRQPAVQRFVAALEIAGPGFINLRLAAAARQAVVAEVLEQGAEYGRKSLTDSTRTERKVLVEFVSANPTGPLHVGHGRQAALGDAICNLFETQGWSVTREFYYNDSGVQIENLARSVQARLRGLAPGDPAWPADAYNGDYIGDIATEFLAGRTVHADDRQFTASGDPNDFDGIRQFAVAYLRHEQDLDLRAFGVRFDNYYLESSLYATGRVDAIVQRLIASGKTFEDSGALWLRSTDFGDDKDRVMRKSTPQESPPGPGAAGSIAARAAQYTYFVPDVAYHVNKLERGFTKAINIQGSDHHGTIARVRAGVRAANPGAPPGFPDYLLHKMVTVMRGGAEVKISKRTGGYVTLRDLIEWTGKDAVRFFMISRKADTEFVFDIDLALKQNDENPVYYVQYAHARICSVLQQYLERGGKRESVSRADLTLLVAPSEAALMLKLAEYPDVLAGAARELAPHDVAFYLRALAGTFHSYYAAERFVVDDAALSAARLALLMATRQTIANALALLGVQAPQRMASSARGTEIA